MALESATHSVCLRYRARAGRFIVVLRPAAENTRQAWPGSPLTPYQLHSPDSGLHPRVQAFTSETRNTERYKRLSSQAVELSQRATVLGSAYGLVNGLVTTIGAAAILYVGGRQVIAGTLSVGSLVVFLTYLRKMQYAADTFSKNVRECQAR